jgi:hypothetical protein
MSLLHGIRLSSKSKAMNKSAVVAAIFFCSHQCISAQTVIGHDVLGKCGPSQSSGHHKRYLLLLHEWHLTSEAEVIKHRFSKCQ